MIQVVAHNCDCLVQEIRDLRLALPLESFLHEVDVVAPTGLDEDLAHGSALVLSVTITTAQPKTDGSSNLVLLLSSHIGQCWVVEEECCQSWRE